MTMDLDFYDSWKGASDPAYDEAYFGGSAHVPMVGAWDEDRGEVLLQRASIARDAARAARDAGDQDRMRDLYEEARGYLAAYRAHREGGGC